MTLSKSKILMLVYLDDTVHAAVLNSSRARESAGRAESDCKKGLWALPTTASLNSLYTAHVMLRNLKGSLSSKNSQF